MGHRLGPRAGSRPQLSSCHSAWRVGSERVESGCHLSTQPLLDSDITGENGTRHTGPMSDDTNTGPAPVEQLIPAAGEAGDTGLVEDSETAGASGATIPRHRSFAQQDADKRPGDGPNARD